MSLVYLSTAYLAPVQYYSKLISYDTVMIEACETYQKQTYRNRCIIASANGLQTLTVPIEKPHISNSQFSILNSQFSILNSQFSILNSQLSTLKDVRISDHGNWQHLHWHALVSAYGMSPFFEYYEEDFAPFYHQKFAFLFDFNEQLRLMICKLLDIHPVVEYTNDYRVEVAHDFRQSIRPRHPEVDHTFTPHPYYQVFQDKHGFQPNLSIVDLLFNMGPEALVILQQ